MAETAKNGFRCLKMYSNVYSPKRAKNTKNIVKKWQKWLKIANNCKISEITKYGEKMRKIHKNVTKNAKKEPKTAKKCHIKKKYIVFLSRN